MSSTDNIKEKLKSLIEIFTHTAVECVNAFFGKECTIHMPWELVEHLQTRFDKVLTLGSSNSRYSALLCSGIQEDSLKAFVGKDVVEPEDTYDILGEFCNTYCGMLSDNKKFTGSFGTLIQALPLLFSNGQSFLPFIWGIQGYLYIGPHWIYMSYTIRKNLHREKGRPHSLIH
jgi:hypothetical protein